MEQRKPLIGIFLLIKIATKFIGIWPAMEMFKFTRKENMYTTLLMSTGLTFGSISALFGLTQRNHQSGAIYNTANGCYTFSSSADNYCTEVVSAGDEEGG